MLTIDDGTFTIGNSFVSLMEADDYHELRASENWNLTTTTDDNKEAALIRAFDYLFIQDWQAGVFDVEIPERVKRAQLVAAEKELGSPGTLQEDKENNLKRKHIEGVIEREYFSKNLSNETIFTEIQNLLKPYLSATTTKTTTQRFLVRM